MQTTLAGFKETQSQEPFSLQNSKMLKVRLDAVTVQARLGSMVAYQGEVAFEHAGSGGMSKMLKRAVPGEGPSHRKTPARGGFSRPERPRAAPLISLETEKTPCKG